MSRVAVVGSGNAGLCAALSAAQQGADVIVLEAGGEADFGGNSRYTAGAMRFAYRGRDDLLALIGVEDPRVADCDFGAYPEAEFEADLRQFSGGAQLNPLQRLLVHGSRPTLRWLAESGVSFEPIYNRQAVLADGRFRFWGGLTLAAVGEGEGLVNRERSLAKPRDANSRSTPRLRLCGRQNTGFAACALPPERRSTPMPWCLPAAALKGVPTNGRRGSARLGAMPRCVALPSTKAPD